MNSRARWFIADTLDALAKGLVVAALLLFILVLLGCSHEAPVITPTVLTEPLEVKCPAVAPRTPDQALLAPLNLEPPELLPAGQGDYGISRESAERVISIVRTCGERIDDWKAWAVPSMPLGGR